MRKGMRQLGFEPKEHAAMRRKAEREAYDAAAGVPDIIKQHGDCSTAATSILKASMRIGEAMAHAASEGGRGAIGKKADAAYTEAFDSFWKGCVRLTGKPAVKRAPRKAAKRTTVKRLAAKR